MTKRIIALALVSILFLYNQTYSQNAKVVPSVKIKNLQGEVVGTETLSNDGKPFIINFWATWCKPCLLELSALNDIYPDWQKETGVKIYCISIDDSRNSKKVAPFVKGRNWLFDVFLDENSDFKRAMNVTNPPHSFLYNGKGELVWEHNGYSAGDEEILYNEILKLVKESPKE